MEMAACRLPPSIAMHRIQTLTRKNLTLTLCCNGNLGVTQFMHAVHVNRMKLLQVIKVCKWDESEFVAAKYLEIMTQYLYL